MDPRLAPKSAARTWSTGRQLTPVVQQRLCGESSSALHREIASVLLRSLNENHTQRHHSVAEFREALLPLVLQYPPISLVAVPVDLSVNLGETLAGDYSSKQQINEPTKTIRPGPKVP